MKNTDDFHYERKLSHATTKLTLLAVSKMNRAQRRTLVGPRRLHCTYYSMLSKGTSRAEVTLNSEKTKYPCLKASVSQSDNQSVENSIK